MDNIWGVIRGAQWPLVVMIIAAMQAKPIGRLLDRIHALKAPGGFEAEMHQPIDLSPVSAYCGSARTSVGLFPDRDAGSPGQMSS